MGPQEMGCRRVNIALIVEDGKARSGVSLGKPSISLLRILYFVHISLFL